MSLKQKLEAIKESAVKRIPPDKLEKMTAATNALRASGIMDGVIQPGARLPAFALANQHGKVIRSEDLLQRGSVVLTVFRGHW